MGVADLIPGISGGTIAFITGIYERLINAITSYNLTNLKQLINNIHNKKERNIILQKFELKFLLTLLFGIFTAILLGSQVIGFLLSNFQIYLLAFFFGLIIASCKIIYNHIEEHNSKDIFIAFIGFLIGTLITFIAPQQIYEPNSFILFFAGIIASSALILPGISGSFILLIMGLYEYIINAVKNIISSYKEVFIFGLGVLIGILTISRIVKFFFRKDKNKTLYFLLGLVIGSLSIPIRNIISTQQANNPITILLLIIFTLIGISIVFLIEKKKK